MVFDTCRPGKILENAELTKKELAVFDLSLQVPFNIGALGDHYVLTVLLKSFVYSWCNLRLLTSLCVH